MDKKYMNQQVSNTIEVEKASKVRRKFLFSMRVELFDLISKYAEKHSVSKTEVIQIALKSFFKL